ncbi:MAG: hypothetical protein CSA81_00350 [Acidobacteria bacterium]|nr:MAG: hypothetical protein CSA81_00350 [Acidobacteriota bacterium]
MKKFFLTLIVLFVSTNMVAAEQQFSAKQHMKQLKEAATEIGPYAAYDRWPKDYFLIPQNLPFMVGLSLYKPGHETIGYSEQQKAEIHKIRSETVPQVIKIAKKIKKMELDLANKLVVEKVPPKDLYYLVDKIAALRAKLTKAHLDCIYSIQQVVTDDAQYARLVELAKTVGQKVQKSKK